MHKQNFEVLKRIVNGFEGRKILVVGDLILDEFIWGKVTRISPEAPVPVVWVDHESFMPGGAANVANNIASLGGEAHLVGVIGNDDHGAVLKGELGQKGIQTGGILNDNSRPTIVKTRVIAHQQQVVRIDREKTDRISDDILAKATDYVKKVLPSMDALIIEDYGKGLITPEVLKTIIGMAKRSGKIISVDPKEDHFKHYRGVTVVTPNASEAYNATGVKIKDDDSLLKAGHYLLDKLRTKIALITLGEEGMAVFEKGKPYRKIPTVAQEVFDVSGAGDTVISTYTLALAAGATPIQAAHVANCAAGVVVGKVGISVVTRQELVRRIKEEISRL
ncbi:MAG: D-glycero-beta-D-manno-heptose-7-phosphate kinase [Candidatus Omnitrophica bacterium]|nr:D-glycero-beta-D-manno-heptose-7-phosphate kinase [Candidatus Omnitrophota bacterium]